MKARYSGLRPVSSVMVATRGRLAAFTSSPEKLGSCGVPVLSDCRHQGWLRLSPWHSPSGPPLSHLPHTHTCPTCP